MIPDLHQLIRDRLLLQAGLQDPLPAPLPGVDIATLWKSQWSQEFETLMRNRLVMGALRYGPLGTPRKTQFDRVSSMIRRLQGYQSTGNLEMLVDVANLALVEYEEGNHPLRHFNSDDTGEHCSPMQGAKP